MAPSTGCLTSPLLLGFSEPPSRTWKRPDWRGEKPFGRDRESAQSLNRVVNQVFDEGRVYRINHCLGKETVQNHGKVIAKEDPCSPALCAYYNGHSAPKLELAILEYLGNYSEQDLVKGHLSAAEMK